MQKSSIKHSALLLLAAFIWGSAFVSQSRGAEYVDAFTFLFLRSVVAVLFLSAVIPFLDKVKPSGKKPATKKDLRTLWIAGISCGFFLFLASFLQQKGIETTTVGKAGFLTACYIVLVPVCGIFLHKKTSPKVALAVLFALGGLYFLCIRSEDFSIGTGDLLILLSSLGFTVQILLISWFSPMVDGVRMSRIQFICITVFSFVAMLVFETPDIASIQKAGWSIFYAGCFSSGIAYTLQIIGQEKVNPTVASLLMSCEALFSVICGFLFLHEAISFREMIGCLLMCVAIVLAQLPPLKKKGSADIIQEN